MVADVEMMDMIELAMAMLLAKAMVMGVDVDVMGRELTSSGSRALSSLSKPHDQLYPMQPYATQPLQFHDFTNPDTNPLQIPNGRRRGRRRGKGNTMSGPPDNGATI